MKTILFLRASNHLGGIERQMLWHARHLHQDGWPVHVAALFRGSGEHPLARAARDAGLASTTLPDPSPWSLTARRNLTHLLAQVQPQIVHTADYRSDVLLASISQRPAWLAETQGHTLERPRMRLWNWLDVQALRRANGIAPVSTAWQQHLTAQGIPQARMGVLGNSRAILLDSQPPHPQQLAGPGPHLLYAGRLSPEKGVDVLLGTWPAVHKKWPLAHLWVLGRLAPGKRWQRRMQELLQQPGVQWMGHVPDIRAWVLAATAVLIPSRQEAWGMTAFEALRLGTPVLATQAGGLPEVCAEAPHAHLVPTCDAQALLAGLDVVLANNFPHGPELGKSYEAHPRFCPKQRHQRLLKLYQQSIERA